MSKLIKLGEELKHGDRITLFYNKAQANWVYFNGCFELPEKIRKDKNGNDELILEGNLSATCPGEGFTKWEYTNEKERKSIV